MSHDCTGPVVLSASTHLSLNAPNALVQETVRAFTTGWYGELVVELPTIANGFITPLAKPGHGMELLPELTARTDAHVVISKDESRTGPWQSNRWPASISWEETWPPGIESLRSTSGPTEWLWCRLSGDIDQGPERPFRLNSDISAHSSEEHSWFPIHPGSPSQSFPPPSVWAIAPTGNHRNRCDNGSTGGARDRVGPTRRERFPLQWSATLVTEGQEVEGQPFGLAYADTVDLSDFTLVSPMIRRDYVGDDEIHIVLTRTGGWLVDWEYRFGVWQSSDRGSGRPVSGSRHR